MKGVISNYRSGRHTQKDNQMIVIPEGVDSKEKAEKLIGKEVVWKSPAEREIKGKITSIHGNKGAVRVMFEKGMPGQSITNKVTIN